MTELALELSDVSAHYGPVRALEGVSIKASAGRITALVGPNGAGKTSTLRVIAGLLPASEGSVVVLGEERCGAKAEKAIRSGVALSPEGRRIFRDMTVRDNLLVGGFEERDRRRLTARLERVYELFPLMREREKSRAGTLSGGQQQMVALGRALMRDVELLLLDEPTLGLSPAATKQVAAKIHEVARAGTTTLLVEQNAGVALELADYVYVIESGRVLSEGSSAEVRHADGLQAGYFGVQASSGTPS